MIQIKELTQQEYENSPEKPNAELCFYATEKDFMRIVSRHLAENIKENIDILKLFLPFNKPAVYEIDNNGKTLYLVYAEETILI
jgi:bisphosphoglycerate-dependent phosphoglycerate mutase